ncbi:TPA: hypothetical protein ACH3X3_012732 [Trebouxia sp. C0006]
MTILLSRLPLSSTWAFIFISQAVLVSALLYGCQMWGMHSPHVAAANRARLDLQRLYDYYLRTICGLLPSTPRQYASRNGCVYKMISPAHACRQLESGEALMRCHDELDGAEPRAKLGL